MGKAIKEFAEEMSVLMPSLLREFFKRQPRLMTKGEITFAQVAILQILKEKEQCMMSELARLLSVTTSAATGIVERMVKARFLKRVRSPKDRRVIRLRITPKGKRTINTIFKQRQKMMIDIFRNFTPKERETHLKNMKKMYTIMTRKNR